MNTGRKIFSLVVIGSAIIMALLPISPRLNKLRAEEQAQFAISPTEFNVDMTVLEPVTVEFVLKNGFAEDLAFSLGVTEESKEIVSTNKLELHAEASGGPERNLNDRLALSVPAEGEVAVKVVITPTAKNNFNAVIKLDLLQEESERRLEEPEYILTLNTDSRIADTRPINIKEVAGVGAIAIGLFLMLALISNKFIQDDDGEESDQ